MPKFYTSPEVYKKVKDAAYKATHKKITRKGCKNVQLVWHEGVWSDESYDNDGYWSVEKIHQDKPAVFITKKTGYVYVGGDIYSFQKKLIHDWEFPHNLGWGE